MTKREILQEDTGIDLYQDELLGNDEFDIVNLKQVVKVKQNEADCLLTQIATALMEKDNSSKERSDEVKYVVDMNNEIKEAFKKGEIRFDINKKTGEVYAQLRKKNGHYGKKLSIKEEINEDVEADDIGLALQMQAIAEKLVDIIDVLEEIGEAVVEVLQGQQNDRIGLYYSGQNLYFESKHISDRTFKSYLLAQSLKTLSDASAQMVQSIKTDIQYLVDKKYKSKKEKSLQIIDDKMIDINKSFEIVHRAFVLRADIYYEQGELEAMLRVLDSYGNFLEKVIVPVSSKLMEYDVNDTLLKEGVWEKRAGAFVEIKDMRKLITLQGLKCIEEVNE